MKKISFIPMLAVAGVFLMSTGCSKTGPAGPNGAQGPAGPALTGNLKGHIFQYDQYGASVLTGLAGIRDSLSPSQVAVTDSTGLYKFTNLSTGDYNFTVAKAGYGTVMAQSVQLVGGGDLYRDLRIAQIPNFNITSATASVNGVTGNVDFVGNVSADTRTRSALLFVGKGVGASANPATYQGVYSANIKATGTTFTISVNPSDIHDLGIPMGGTIYFAMYGAATTWNSASTYQDQATGRNVYNAISTTPSTGNVVAP
jgi:hypothetical protein